MTIVSKTLKRLLPEGSAWEGKQVGTLGNLLDGISREFERQKLLAEDLGNAIFPSKTKFIEEWESEFVLPDSPALTEDDQRARLEGRWALITLGSMQAENMEFIFALSKIDIVARPLAPGENPVSYFLFDGQAYYGNLLAMYGRPRYGDGFPISTPDSYLIINGGSFDYAEDPIDSAGQIPSDQDFWGMFYVIEGEAGAVLQIDNKYREVVFDLIYATKPTHMWCILRANFFSFYVFPPPGLSETRRIYWTYDGGSDTSTITFIMDAIDANWGAPADDYALVANATATYKRLVGASNPVPDANTFDGNTASPGDPGTLSTIEILNLGSGTADYEKVNQGSYIEHIFYLRNNGIDTATLSVDGIDYASDSLAPVEFIIEFDENEKQRFDADNPEGVVIA